jgi:branched-chain amino acid transport system substrate-binding protein
LHIERVSFDPKTNEYQPLAQSLRTLKPHALLLLANASHSTGLLSAWKAQENLTFVLNLAGQANALFAQRMQGYTGLAAFVTVVPSPWEAKSPLQREYHRVAQSAKLPLSYLGFEAFINARLLSVAVQKAKPANARELETFLGEQSNLDLGGYTVHYSERRVGSNFTDLSLLRNDGSYRH